MKDLKPVYLAETLELAKLRLDGPEAKRGKKYEKVLESWRNNRPKLSTYFRHDAAIRKLIYTTNTIEGFIFILINMYIRDFNTKAYAQETMPGAPHPGIVS